MMRAANDYRQCRCGAGPSELRIMHLAECDTGMVMMARCLICRREVPALVTWHQGALVDAWSEANVPEGRDAGIESMFPWNN
jgi:hypothetical protein